MTSGGDGSTAGDGNGSRGNGSGGDEDDLDLLQDENGKSDDGGEDDDGKSDGGNGGDDIGISYPGRRTKVWLVVRGQVDSEWITDVRVV
ncbi:hypothetical protein Tco_1391977 [Tanacetum coccineum]